MDPETTDMVKATSAGISEGVARAFFERVAGFAVEASEWAKDAVRFRRWKTQVMILEKAHAFLDERGVDPATVSLKTLAPLLDIGSLEDPADEEMIARWAALLANASAGTRGAEVLPSFPRILGELSPQEALILDRLYDESPRPFGNQHQHEGIRANELAAIAGFTHDESFLVYLGGLLRHGLCSYSRFAIIAPNIGEPIPALSTYITELGRAFVEACRPPAVP